MEKTEEIKIYIEHLLYNYLQFYELSKSAKSFNYDIIGELDKITESMNIILPLFFKKLNYGKELK